MAEPQIAQPANFVLQVALSALWRSWGIEPAAIAGHSVGEVAAAYVSGALTLEDSVLVSYHRSRLQQQTSGEGAMLAVGLSVDAAREAIADVSTLVSIAAVNGPTSVTLSGDPDALHQLDATLNEKNVFSRLLRVDVAYHSHHMDRLEGELRESLRGLRPVAPRVPLYSTVTGRRMQEGEHHDAGYWYQNVRWPVLFKDAVDSLAADGHTLFVEIGPHPVLSASISECLSHRSIAGRVLSTLRRNEPESVNLLSTLGELYTSGVPVDWGRVYAQRGRFVRLPTYPWQRERYWDEEQAASSDRTGKVVHPLLGSVVPMAVSMWQADLSPAIAPYLADHVIQGVPVVPAAAYVEAGLAVHHLLGDAGRATLEDMEFHRALVLDGEREARLQWSYDAKSGQYRAFTRALGDGSEWTCHASGRISPAAPIDAEPVDLIGARARCTEYLEAEALYNSLREHGLQYGPAFQGVRGLWRGPREAIARLDVGLSDGAESAEHHVHPALLDASFQTMIATLESDEDTAFRAVYLPTRVGEVRYFSNPGMACWCHASLTIQSDAAIEGDIRLCDDHGNVVVEVRGLRCSALAAKNRDETRQLQQWTYAFEWEAGPALERVVDDATWVVFSDEGGLGALLADQLGRDGGTVIQVTKGDQVERKSAECFQVRRQHAGDVEDVLGQIDVASCRGVVYLWGLDLGRDEQDPVGIAGVADGLNVVQWLARAGGSSTPRLFIVTRGAQQIDREPITGLAQTPLLGLSRVAASEHPDLRCSLIDLDSVAQPAAVEQLATEVQSGNEEDEVALRDSGRYVRRLTRVSAKQLEEANLRRGSVPATDTAAYRLEVGTIGSMDSLRFREFERSPLGPRDVEIRILSAALNFKDVLKVLGMLPEKALEHTFHGSTLGMEAAGVVTRTGDDVTEYRVGDACIASLSGSFSSHVIVPVDSLFAVHQSAIASPSDAATIPVVYMTAYYALHDLARLSKGERVLVHAAAGGVGLAAIQVARWLGAEVFATAGSPEKRDYLRRLGVEHIWDSRTLEFADGIRRVTGGRGVDVALNSIPGEHILKTLAVMAPFGRFVEIGKRDIVENNRLPMLPFNRNLTFAAVDLDQMMVDKPELVRRTLRAVWEQVEAGHFSPLPVRVFPAAQVSDAFRYMAQAKQIGKVVVDMANLDGVSLLPSREKEKRIHPDASYLVTGGFGGFGLEVARWLASSGARHLVLVGRRGPSTPRAVQVVEELTQRGVAVRSVMADVSQEADVAAMLAEVRNSMPPLRGIFHTAAVLDDALLMNLDASRIASVMTPKALGAWMLHQHTRSMPLDLFVLFSSATTWMGNPGQGNYVAANAFLDGLAQHRRSEGLAATSVSWGAIGDVGMLASNAQASDHLSRMGIYPIPVASATEALSHLLAWDPSLLAVMHIDWSRWRQVQPTGARAPRMTRLLGDSTQSGQMPSADLRAVLEALSPESRLERITSAMAEVVGETLRMPVAKVDIRQPLSDMGIDSLVGVELQLTISSTVGIEISLLELMNAGSIVDLGRRLLAKMNFPNADAPLDVVGGVSTTASLVSS
jgi:acyl transferase domain-containing protein/NAD(P)-dependent dehydrogenase (short-subunit alcohol dehydrogenase family)